MQDITLLKSLGLKDAEAQIYCALLEEGSCSIRQLASITGINRGTTYDSLKQLVNTGLVGFNQKGERRKYFAEDPSKINDLITKRKRELSDASDEAKLIIPKLLALGKRAPGGEPIVRFYEDDEGIVAILRDVLSTTAGISPKEYCVYSSRSLRQYIYKRFPNFTRQRIKEGIFVKVVAVGEGGEPAELSERKWLAQPSGERLSSYVIIYGSKVALISVSPDDTPYGVIIEEPGVAAMQRYLFSTLWDSLPGSTPHS